MNFNSAISSAGANPSYKVPLGSDEAPIDADSPTHFEKFKAKLEGDLQSCKSYVSPKADEVINSNVSPRTAKSHLAHGAIKALLGVVAGFVGLYVTLQLTLWIGAAIAIGCLFMQDPDKKAEWAILAGRIAVSPMQPAMALFRAAYEDFKTSITSGEISEAISETVVMIKHAPKQIKDEIFGLGGKAPPSGTGLSGTAEASAEGHSGSKIIEEDEELYEDMDPR